MTRNEALELHAKFLELRREVIQALPKAIMLPHPYYEEREPVEYKLDVSEIDLANLTARYVAYMGCGDYDYHYATIDLSSIFSE